MILSHAHGTFFREHSCPPSGGSPTLATSYAYSFQSLVRVRSQKLRVAPSALMLEQLGRVSDQLFLEPFGDRTWQLRGDTKHPFGCHPLVLRFLQHHEPAASDRFAGFWHTLKKTDHPLCRNLAQKKCRPARRS